MLYFFDSVYNEGIISYSLCGLTPQIAIRLSDLLANLKGDTGGSEMFIGTDDRTQFVHLFVDDNEDCFNVIIDVGPSRAVFVCKKEKLKEFADWLINNEINN